MDFDVRFIFERACWQDSIAHPNKDTFELVTHLKSFFENYYIKKKCNAALSR